MGIWTSVLLILFGAILVWAAPVTIAGFSANAAGVILAIVGIGGLLAAASARAGRRDNDAALPH